jgi:hypothetical protein
MTKLSDKQLELLKLINDGWTLAISTSTLVGRPIPHLQKGKIGCGGEVKSPIDRRTIYSLSIVRHFIKYNYNFPTAFYTITPEGLKYLEENK